MTTQPGPRFPLGYCIQVGYLGLYRADEEATTRNGLPIDPPYTIDGVRLAPYAQQGEWDEDSQTLGPDRVAFPKGWEYHCGRVTKTGRYVPGDWYTEAELLKAGYEPPPTQQDRMRAFKEQTKPADTSEIEALYTETQGGE